MPSQPSKDLTYGLRKAENGIIPLSHSLDALLCLVLSNLKHCIKSLSVNCRGGSKALEIPERTLLKCHSGTIPNQSQPQPSIRLARLHAENIGLEQTAVEYQTLSLGCPSLLCDETRPCPKDIAELIPNVYMTSKENATTSRHLASGLGTQSFPVVMFLGKARGSEPPCRCCHVKHPQYLPAHLSQTRRVLFDIATCIREIGIYTVGPQPCRSVYSFLTTLRHAVLRHIAHRLPIKPLHVHQGIVRPRASLLYTIPG